MRRLPDTKLDESHATLGQLVEHALVEYFDHLEGSTPTNLHDLVIQQVEQALYASTLNHTDGNQSKAADILGISRTTLRKKLMQYQLL